MLTKRLNPFCPQCHISSRNTQAPTFSQDNPASQDSCYAVRSFNIPSLKLLDISNSESIVLKISNKVKGLFAKNPIYSNKRKARRFLGRRVCFFVD